VFLDLKMPGMDGMDVLRRIKDDWPTVRVIIITAHGTIESAVEAMKSVRTSFKLQSAEIRVGDSRSKEALDEEHG
jgi:DNA-binding NtrC family response regulator